MTACHLLMKYFGVSLSSIAHQGSSLPFGKEESFSPLRTRMAVVFEQSDQNMECACPSKCTCTSSRNRNCFICARQPVLQCAIVCLSFSLDSLRCSVRSQWRIAWTQVGISVLLFQCARWISRRPSCLFSYFWEVNGNSVWVDSLCFCYIQGVFSCC